MLEQCILKMAEKEYTFIDSSDVFWILHGMHNFLIFEGGFKGIISFVILYYLIYALSSSGALYWALQVMLYPYQDHAFGP